MGEEKPEGGWARRNQKRVVGGRAGTRGWVGEQKPEGGGQAGTRGWWVGELGPEGGWVS